MHSSTQGIPQRCKRSSKGISELSQFPLAMYILFMIALLPLLNLVTLFVAGATQYLATNDIVSKASTQADYASALSNMANEAKQFQSYGLAKFVNMQPQGGYTGSGNDLYVLATDVKTGTVTSSVADQPLTQKIKTSANIYEFQVKSKYSVAPLISLAPVPVLGNVPGLGKPVVLTFAASRPVEHPGGLQVAASTASGGVVALFNRVAVHPSTTPPPTVVTWRNPQIFNQIAAAGQTVVNVNVFTVYGNQNWQNSSVTTAPGQNTWIDTQAVGTWGLSPITGAQGNLIAQAGINVSTDDANGIPQIPASSSLAAVDQNTGGSIYALLGYVGNPPPVVAAVPSPSDPKMFQVGNTLTNYQLPGTGPLFFTPNYNDATTYGAGSQIVRIIVTQ